VRYDFSRGNAFIDLTQTMGYPASVSFGKGGASRVLLGYSGMIALPGYLPRRHQDQELSVSVKPERGL
jgi:hypothetical protein